MRIAHIEEESFIYGPGRRFVIWTQGCSIRCPGCWNDAMWDFSGGTKTTVDELYEKISAGISSIEGVTILGGEPLDQFEETLELLNKCKTSGLGTMLYTGYEMPEIEYKKMSAIFSVADILITGSYEGDKRTLNREWIGSTNQEIHFLSDRYRNYKKSDANYVEVTIEESGSITILGFPDLASSPK
ncbi:radical SAM protein [Spirochaetia bacterium]|nr:radical SAM protein [Spirochaetia bacterium]